MNYNKFLLGAAGLLPLVNGASDGEHRVLIAGGLSTVFSPYFLCSSAPCKALTSDIMSVVNLIKDSITTLTSAGDDARDLVDELAFADVAWCPADPSDGAAAKSSGKTIKQTFKLGGTVEAFGTSQRNTFKQKYVDAINGGITNEFLRLLPAQVTLTVSAGSINVEAAVEVASTDLASSVTTSMTALTSQSTAALTTSLGVTVEEAPAAPTEEVVVEQQAVAIVANVGGSSGSPVVLIAAAAAVLVIIAVVLTCMKMKMGKGAKSPSGANSKV
jgi:hypothetical protein